MGVITVTFNNISAIILCNFIDEGHGEYPVKTTKDRLYNGQKKKSKQWSTKHYTDKDWATRILLKSGGEFVCSGRESS